MPGAVGRRPWGLAGSVEDTPWGSGSTCHLQGSPGLGDTQEVPLSLTGQASGCPGHSSHSPLSTPHPCGTAQAAPLRSSAPMPRNVHRPCLYLPSWPGLWSQNVGHTIWWEAAQDPGPGRGRIMVYGGPSWPDQPPKPPCSASPSCNYTKVVMGELLHKVHPGLQDTCHLPFL